MPVALRHHDTTAYVVCISLETERASGRYWPPMKPLKCPEGDPPASPFVPSEEWIEALEAQMTSRLIEGAERYAARLVHGLSRDGHPNDQYYLRELVQDVLADTALGVLRWDPSAKALDRHVRDALRVRTHQHRARARRFPRASLDVHDDEPSATMAEVEAALSERAAEPAADEAARRGHKLARIRERAADDPQLVAMLNAFEDDATTKEEVMRATGMTALEYKNARRRLARLATQLDEGAQPAAGALVKGA